MPVEVIGGGSGGGSGGGAAAPDLRIPGRHRSGVAYAWDDVTRADSTTEGNGWVDPASAWRVLSGKFDYVGTSPQNNAYERDSLLRPFTEAHLEQKIEATHTFGAVGGNDSFGIVLRVRSDLPGVDRYLCTVTGGGVYNIYQISGSSVTPISTTGTVGNFSVGQRIRMVATASGTSPTTVTMQLYDYATGAVLIPQTDDPKRTASNGAATNQVAGTLGIAAWNKTNTITADEIRYTYGVTTKANIVFVGDSIPFGEQTTSPGGMSGTSYPARTIAKLGPYAQGVNLGVSGKAVGPANQSGTMLYDAATQTAANYATGLVNVAVIEGLPNDVYQGADADTCRDRMFALCDAWRAAGYKVVLLTMTPGSHPLYPANYETIRQTINDSLRGGTSHYDALVDMGRDPVMGAPGQQWNSEYFAGVDRLHDANGGAENRAFRIAPVVRALCGSALAP